MPRRRPPDRFRLLRHALAATSASTFAATLVVIAQSPFAAPLVARNAEAARLAIEREMAARLADGTLGARMTAALADGDTTRARLLADEARERDIALPAQAAARLEAAERRERRAGQRIRVCGACGWDAAACPSVPDLMWCHMPVQLTPAGDLSALARNAALRAQGDPVDRIETGLALAGLAATTLVLASGGASATVKAGATVVRVMHRAGRLSPGLTRALARAARIEIDWPRLPAVAHGAPIADVVDTAALSRLVRIGQDLGELRVNTSTADVLRLLPRIENPADAARFARASEVLGRETAPAVAVLGKARVFRLTLRLSDLAIAALSLLAALLGQLLALAAWVLRRAVRPPRDRGIA